MPVAQDGSMRNEMADAGEPIDQVWPNLELFVATIQPIMVGCGGLTCHKAEMVTLDDTFLQFETSPGGVVTSQAANNFAEFTQERMINYENPAEVSFSGTILRVTPDIFGGNTDRWPGGRMDQ